METGGDAPATQLNLRPVVGSYVTVEQGLISVWLKDHLGWSRDHVVYMEEIKDQAHSAAEEQSLVLSLSYLSTSVLPRLLEGRIWNGSIWLPRRSWNLF